MRNILNSKLGKLFNRTADSVGEFLGADSMEVALKAMDPALERLRQESEAFVGCTDPECLDNRHQAQKIGMISGMGIVDRCWIPGDCDEQH